MSVINLSLTILLLHFHAVIHHNNSYLDEDVGEDSLFREWNTLLFFVSLSFPSMSSNSTVIPELPNMYELSLNSHFLDPDQQLDT
jgi:hypothetical protein